MTIFNWNYFNAESANKKSDITAGFLILQIPRKHLLLCSLLTFCCLQSVKDTKFESNSQLMSAIVGMLGRCLQSVKDTKFESNSQHMVYKCSKRLRCLQSVKDTKFESNSQPSDLLLSISASCLQSVKDTKFESNSQHVQNWFKRCRGCLQSVKGNSQLLLKLYIINYLLFAVRQRYKV